MPEGMLLGEKARARRHGNGSRGQVTQEVNYNMGVAIRSHHATQRTHFHYSILKYGVK